MTAAQTRIAETIDAFYGEAGTRDNVSAYYRQAVEDLDAQTVKELVNPPSLPLPPPLESIFCVAGSLHLSPIVGRTLSNLCNRPNIPFLRLLPRHQRSHQKALP
jgi:hypothetical protein